MLVCCYFLKFLDICVKTENYTNLSHRGFQLPHGAFQNGGPGLKGITGLTKKLLMQFFTHVIFAAQKTPSMLTKLQNNLLEVGTIHLWDGFLIFLSKSSDSILKS